MPHLDINKLLIL